METTLTQLQQSFADWRASSSTKRHSNANLRTQAVKCLDYYSQREVSTAIGVSVNSLRSWQKSLESDQEVINKPPSFVAMNLDPVKDIDTVNQTQFSLQISLSNGIAIQVNASSIKSSIELIIALNKESRPCSI